jgi:glycosyltransferase involved in cell wall biosynthesis
MGDERPIAFFVPSLRGGGAERAMLDLARGFASRGVKVDLVLAQAEGPYIAMVPATIRVVDLRAKRILASLWPLVKYLRSVRPRALLATHTHANLAALWAKRLARVSTRIVIRQATTGSHPIYRNGSPFRFHFFHRLARYCYPWAEGIVAVSEGVAEDMCRHLGLKEDRIDVIYNAVFLDEIEKLAQQQVSHPWFQLPELPIILSAGRLSTEKDFPTLLRAFERVLRKRPARLVILGEGIERPSLSRLIRELGIDKSVDMPGFVGNPFAYMARSAVYVLSSISEGMPNALVQAALLGVPIVSTDCPSGPREIVREGGGGYLVQVGNDRELASAILKVLGGEGKALGRKNLLSVFSDGAVLKAYGEILFKGEAHA